MEKQEEKKIDNQVTLERIPDKKPRKQKPRMEIVKKEVVMKF